MTSSNPSEVTLTPRETQLLAAAWRSCDQQPKVDYQKVAELTGYTVGSAKTTFQNVQRKLRGAISSEGSPAKRPSKPTQKDGLENGDVTNGSPQKSTTSRGRKAPAADGENPPSAKKGAGGRGRKKAASPGVNGDNGAHADVTMEGSPPKKARIRKNPAKSNGNASASPSKANSVKVEAEEYDECQDLKDILMGHIKPDDSLMSDMEGMEDLDDQFAA